MEDIILSRINDLLIDIQNTEKKLEKSIPKSKQDITKLKAQDGDIVEVHYIGKLPDGTEFDNSWSKNKPFSFTVGKNQVIKGWDVIIKKMHLGDKIRVKIPSGLAYGKKGIGNIIPPNSDLIFVIKLLKINNITINDKN